MLVTFVCTGNTCRSAMAEGLFRKILRDRGVGNIECRSCGISAWTGDSATEYAILAAESLGADISSHRSTLINPYITAQSDLIVCMTLNHKRAVMSLEPACPVIVPGSGISDPYGFGLDTYIECAAQIYDYLESLADVLCADIVSMTEEHIAGVAELEKQCFSAPWSEDGVRAELGNGTAHFLVAVSGGKVIGYIGVHEVCGEAYIANIAVDRAHRRMTLGRRLLNAARDAAKSRDCEFISLEVRKSNTAAIGLYSGMGFEAVGERKNFYTAPSEDAVIMTLKDL